MAKHSSSKINFDQLRNLSSLKSKTSDTDDKKWIGEIGQVILAAKEKPKDEAFAFVWSQISDSLLLTMLESSVDREKDEPDEEDSAASSFMLLSMFLRQHLHGNQRGGFEASDEELFDIVNTVVPYATIELVRRRGCFGVLELPASPWAFNAALHIREPNRAAIERTIQELEALQVPIFPLLSDEEDLQRMEQQDLGVVVKMGVRGRSVATEEMLQIQPQKAVSLDPQTFVKAFEAVNARAFGTESMPDLPSDMPSEVDWMDKTGSTSRIDMSALHHSAEGRMISIVHEHFGDDYEEYRSALLRLYGLSKMLRDGTLAAWIQETPRGPSLHPAILVTAATTKLTKGGGFAPVKFQKEVQRLVAESKR